MTIKINPPQVVPYAPASTPVASARLTVHFDGCGGVSGSARVPSVHVKVKLLTATGAVVPYDESQIPPFSKANQAAFLAYVAGSTDTLAVAVQKAILPYLASAYKVTGVVS
jgi:hypothetical protein